MSQCDKSKVVICQCKMLEQKDWSPLEGFSRTHAPKPKDSNPSLTDEFSISSPCCREDKAWQQQTYVQVEEFVNSRSSSYLNPSKVHDRSYFKELGLLLQHQSHVILTVHGREVQISNPNGACQSCLYSSHSD